MLRRYIELIDEKTTPENLREILTMLLDRIEKIENAKAEGGSNG